MKLREILRRIFPHRKPKNKTFGTEIATEAFRHKGKVYYSFQDTFKMPAGRSVCALAIYEELRMRCTSDYLRKHIAATKAILNPGDKKIKLTDLAIINNNLEERLNLAPFPDHIYKLASVIYFDENESPYSYDFDYNQKKIADWKKDGELLYFFLNMPFSDLIPFGKLSNEQVQKYFNTAGMIDQLHQSTLRGVLSSKP